MTRMPTQASRPMAGTHELPYAKPPSGGSSARGGERCRQVACGKNVSWCPNWWRVVYLTLLLLLLNACSQTTPVVLALTGNLTLRTPTEITAGEPLVVVIERSDAPNNLEVILLTQGSYGPGIYRTRFQAGRAELRIPGEETQVAGLLSLRARAGDATGTAELNIRPGAAVDPVTPLVGPRTIMADGMHWATLVAIPFDAYGNPIAENTPVQFQVRRPDGSREQFDVPTTHLLAWRRLFSSTSAGRTTITAVVGSAHGPEAGLDETPSWPASLPLSAEPQNLPADGRRLLTLRVGPIIDAHGNQMLDGTLITFVAEAPDGEARSIPAYTIDSVAEVRLQAPTTPGVMTVRATLYGVESEPLAIRFTPGPAVGDISVATTIDRDDGTVTINAGPLLGELEQFVPEGTPIEIVLTNPDGSERRMSTTAVAGYAQIVLQLTDLAPGTYQVIVRVGSGAGQTDFSVP